MTDDNGGAQRVLGEIRIRLVEIGPGLTATNITREGDLDEITCRGILDKAREILPGLFPPIQGPQVMRADASLLKALGKGRRPNVG
jgi:hypothetical protein